MPVGSNQRHVRTPRHGLAPALRVLLRMWRPALQFTVAAGILAQGAGCTRSFYRKSADKEVSEILGDKDKYPAWKIQNFHVYPDARARFGDPTDPDRPPKPPDDPAAYDSSPNPQNPGRAGVDRVEGKGYLEIIAEWDRQNRERDAREDSAEDFNFPVPPNKLAAAAAVTGPLLYVPPAPAAPAATLGPLAILRPPIGSTRPTGRAAAATIELARAVSSGTDSNAVRPAVAVAPDDRPAGTGPAADMPKSDPPSARDTLAATGGRTSLDVAGRPTYRLTLEQAAELAMFNGREYQDRRENLYLACLPVTLERFAFSPQLFAATRAIRQYIGREAPGGPSNSWSINSGIGLAKVLPTGALLLLNFSNQTVFEFLNPKRTISASTLNFNAIQPLLRGGGQAVALESLTQVERNLLYTIRSFARFRKELYVAIASNSGGSISGGSFQPTGVLTSTSVGAGFGGSGLAIGSVAPLATTLSGPVVAPVPPGTVNLAPAISPPPSGYLNTMLQLLQIDIDKENIDVLQTILQRYRGLLEGDIVGPLQVQSVEQQLLSGRAQLLLDQQQYLDAVDSFKIALGIPTQVNIEMDDAVLRPLVKQFRRSRAIIEQEQAAVMEASRLIPVDQVARLRPELLRLFEKSAFVSRTEFARRIRARVGEWAALSDEQLKARLEELRQKTQELLNRQAELERQDRFLSPAEEARLRDLGSQTDLGNFERVLRRYEADYGGGKALDPVAERRRVTHFRDVISLWQKVLVEARDERWAAIRSAWPDLPRCCVDGVDLVRSDITRAETAAAQHALENRLDLMNVRAQMVDAWRQLAVFANALLGTFTVQYQVTTTTPPNSSKPFNIGGSANAHQLILNASPPLVRVAERNNYRAAQIAYQRQRRNLQEAEDLAVRAVRAEIHQLRVYAESYKIQQRQLELAYLTIDSSLEALQAPTRPAAAGGGGADGPAALTQQLLQAQRTLPSSQNALLAIWINYLNARLQLYRDLELMPIDARGVWIDEIRDCDCNLTTPAAAQPADGRPTELPPPRDETPGVERLPAPRELPPDPVGVE